MGIFKKLINKVLDIEMPPVVERLVRKELAKKNASSTDLVKISPQIGPVIYSEREIPDDSEEAKRIREAQQQQWNKILSGMIPLIEKSPYFKPEKKTKFDRYT